MSYKRIAQRCNERRLSISCRTVHKAVSFPAQRNREYTLLLVEWVVIFTYDRLQYISTRCIAIPVLKLIYVYILLKRRKPQRSHRYILFLSKLRQISDYRDKLLYLGAVVLLFLRLHVHNDSSEIVYYLNTSVD